MEFFGTHRLVPHPEKGPKAVQSVEVDVLQATNTILLMYRVEPADTLLLPAHGRERRDNLWRNTCFELFVKPESHGYVEYNFAPLSAWNAYSFADWRMGRRAYQPEAEPSLVDSRTDGRRDRFPRSYELDVVISPDILSFVPATLSLAAVIEEDQGPISYWALAHPPGDLNFHHPDCFVARLP